MINNPQGKKLSKRDGAMDVMEYKKLGYLPEALLNFLVRLGWSYGDQEIFSIDELLELFDPHNINKSASAYNEDKLLWLNSHYIKNTPNEKLELLLQEFNCNIKGHDKAQMVLDLIKERASTLVELKNGIETILATPQSYDKKGVKKFIKENTIDILNDIIKLLQDNNNLHLPTDYETIIKPYIQQNNFKFPQVFQPIRIALTSSTQAPSVYDLLAILGKEESIKRLQNAIQLNFNKDVL
jgi:glutamyl-tRNA synthetase